MKRSRRRTPSTPAATVISTVIATGVLGVVGVLAARGAGTYALWSDEEAFSGAAFPLVQWISWRQEDPFRYLPGTSRTVDLLVPSSANGQGEERPVRLDVSAATGVDDPGTPDAELHLDLLCTPVTTITSPVAAGEETGTDRAHWLVVDDAGGVWAWGSDAQGRLGLYGDGQGSDDSTLTPARLRSEDLPRPVTAVAAGATHSLALDVEGSVWVWGANTARQLGVDLPFGWTEIHTPRQVPASAFTVDGVAQRVIAVAAGHSHSMALTADGSVWHWGRTPNGGTHATPQRMPLPDGARAVALTTSSIGADGDPARHQTSFVVTESGEVLGWGYNGSPVTAGGSTLGLLGVGSSVSPPGFLDGFGRVGVSASADRPFGGEAVVAIDTHEGTTLAVTASGRLWGWGPNRDAASLGRTGTVAAWEQGRFPGLSKFPLLDWPTPIVEHPGILGDVQLVAVSAANGTALGHDGRVWSWGTQSGRGVGTPGTVQYLVPDAGTAVTPGSLTGVLPIEARVVSLTGTSDGSTNRRATLAVQADGHLRMWGSDWSNGFGDPHLQQDIADVWDHPLTTPNHPFVAPTIAVRTPAACDSAVVGTFLSDDVDLWLVHDGERVDWDADGTVEPLDVRATLPVAVTDGRATLTFALPELHRAVDGFDGEWKVEVTRKRTTSVEHRFFLTGWELRP